MHVLHLERYTELCDNGWKRLPNDDIEDTRLEQIVPYIVEEMCDFTYHTAIFKLTMMALKQNLNNYFKYRLYLF